MSNRYNISIRIFPSILQKQRMQPNFIADTLGTCHAQWRQFKIKNIPIHTTKILNATYFYDTEKSFKHAILRVDNKKVRTCFTDIPKTTYTT